MNEQSKREPSSCLEKNEKAEAPIRRKSRVVSDVLRVRTALRAGDPRSILIDSGP